MKKLASVIFLAMLFLGFDNTEVQVGNERLEITCQKCGYVFYVCGVNEFFDMEPVANYTPYCTPNKGVGPLSTGTYLKCPICGTEPFTTFEEGGNRISRVHTNKGWMPQRRRPK